MTGFSLTGSKVLGIPGLGSPGGGGVNPASKTNQLKKMGIDSNEKWLKKNQQKIYDYNNNFNLLQGVMGDLA